MTKNGPKPRTFYMARSLGPIRFFMLILTLSTTGPLSPPLIAQNSDSAPEAPLHWRLSTSLDDLDSLSSRLILESSLPLARTSPEAFHAELLILERERFPLGERQTGTHEYLPGISLSQSATGGFCIVGPITSSGLLKRLDRPMDRSLALLDRPRAGTYSLDYGTPPSRLPAIALGMGALGPPGKSAEPLAFYSEAFLDEERLALGARIVAQRSVGTLTVEGIRCIRQEEAGEPAPWFAGQAGTRASGTIVTDGISTSLFGSLLSGRIGMACTHGPWISSEQYFQGLVRLAGSKGIFGLGADVTSEGWLDTGGTRHELAWRVEIAGQSAVWRGQKAHIRAQVEAARGNVFTLFGRGRWERTGTSTIGLESLLFSHEQVLDDGLAAAARSEAKASLRAGGLSGQLAVRADWAGRNFGAGRITLGAGYRFGVGPTRNGGAAATISLDGMTRLDFDTSSGMEFSGRVGAGIRGRNAGLNSTLSLSQSGVTLDIRAHFSGIFH